MNKEKLPLDKKVRNSRVITEKTKNAEEKETQEKKLCLKNIIIHGVAESSSVSKDDRVKSGDVYRTNFTAALKVRFTIKRESKKAVLIPK